MLEELIARFITEYKGLPLEQLQAIEESALMGDACDDHDGTPEGKLALRERLRRYEAQSIAVERLMQRNRDV